jgi:hypothetical protein
MGQRAEQLARQIDAFRRDLLAFVQDCSDENWTRTLEPEAWSVGVTARHLGAGHLAISDLAAMIVNGKNLPEFTPEQLREMGNDHARRHADCTRSEVAEIINTKGIELADYVAGLSDEDLDREAYLSLAGGNVTTQQLIEMVLLQSGGEHFSNMRQATDETPGSNERRRNNPT